MAVVRQSIVPAPPLTLPPAEGHRDLPAATKSDGQPESQGQDRGRHRGRDRHRDRVRHQDRDRSAKRSPLLVELAVIAFLGWIYDWLQDLAPVRLGLALRNGRAILSFEERLHISPERYLDHWLAHHYWVAYIASDFYDNAIFVFTAGIAIWLWWRRPDIYRPLRNDLVLANLIGFAVFWKFPVAPPRMLPGFTDVVEKVGGLGSWHSTLISHADQLAAMPSMHLAWAVWCSVVLWRLAGKTGWRWAALAVGVAYPLATAWVVMATANHYLMDVLAGAAATAVSVVVVEMVSPRALKALRGFYQRSST